MQRNVTVKNLRRYGKNDTERRVDESVVVAAAEERSVEEKYDTIVAAEDTSVEQKQEQDDTVVVVEDTSVGQQNR